MAFPPTMHKTLILTLIILIILCCWWLERHRFIEGDVEGIPRIPENLELRTLPKNTRGEINHEHTKSGLTIERPEPPRNRGYEASWYSQENLISSRKAIAGDDFGVAVNASVFGDELGDRFTLCYQGRCVTAYAVDACAACGTTYPERRFDLQREAFEALTGNLELGVIEVMQL